MSYLDMLTPRKTLNGAMGSHMVTNQGHNVPTSQGTCTPLCDGEQ